MEQEWWMSPEAGEEVSPSGAFLERIAWRLGESAADPVGLADRLLNEVQLLRQRVAALEQEVRNSKLRKEAPRRMRGPMGGVPR